MSIERNTLLSVFNGCCSPNVSSDYGPNGLQVEGKSEIRRIVSGVTASRALIEAAIEVGPMPSSCTTVCSGAAWMVASRAGLKERIRLLLAHDINLFAYHLPLDAHAELGNNAQLGARLGCRPGGLWRAEPGLADVDFADAAAGRACAKRAGAKGDAGRWGSTSRSASGLVHRRAQGFSSPAIAAGADAYITGEISEPQMHLAQEMGVSFIAAGHHATERYGAPAVVAHVAWGVRAGAPLHRYRQPGLIRLDLRLSLLMVASTLEQEVCGNSDAYVRHYFNPNHRHHPGRLRRHGPGNHRQGFSGCAAGHARLFCGGELQTLRRPHGAGRQGRRRRSGHCPARGGDR